MAYFAKVEDGVVINVIVADQATIDSGMFGTGWIETFKNVQEGQARPRKNYASVGYTYDNARDAFIPPKQFASWILNEDTCRWEPPIPRPQDGKRYFWNESTVQWELIPENT